MGEAFGKSKIEELAIVAVWVSKEKITAEISDGRIISIPTSWFPKIESSPIEQMQNFEISPTGYGVHWPEIDEDISIKAFVS